MIPFRALALGLALFAFGCASARVGGVRFAPGADPAPLAAKVERYNELPGVYRVLGTLKFSGAPAISFGARAGAGQGVRLDGVAYPSSKLLFSLACRFSDGCEVFFPDDFVVYREKAGAFADWLPLLVTGRIPLIGSPTEAGLTREGASVVRFSDRRGQWEQVVFSAGEEVPSEIIFGDAASGAKLRIAYSGWLKVDGRRFPGRTEVTGNGSREELVIEALRVERSGAGGGDAFGLRVPEGALLKDSPGRDTWKRMGMFWTPLD